MNSLEKEEKRKNTEALQSPFMRVPRMDLTTSRYLLELGYQDLFQLKGLSPEFLWGEIRAIKKDFPQEKVYFLRMLLYFIEEENPRKDLMYPDCWM